MALSLEETLDLMRAQSGRHFDPVLLDLLFDNLDEALEIRAGYPEAEEETPNILELIKGI
jgi:HD-GYP domain-containing protein (c-di-GMP phosphodiesterase class II)